MPTSTVREVYDVRWQVELAFKLFKSDARIETTLGREKHRVECELYAKLIALLLFNRLGGVAEDLTGEKLAPAKLWRRLRSDVADLLQTLGQGTAQTLCEMLKCVADYAKPGTGKQRPSTLQGLRTAAAAARQVNLKDPLRQLSKKQTTKADIRKALARSLKSHKVTLNFEQLGIQRTTSLP